LLQLGFVRSDFQTLIRQCYQNAATKKGILPEIPLTRLASQNVVKEVGDTVNKMKKKTKRKTVTKKGKEKSFCR